jgi:ABC-type sugar transport system ATPase subunit
MAEVRLEGLEKRIGSTAILHPLTLTIRDGEFFVLVGPSGCGKSTLLHLLAGLDRPSAGRILFDGVDVTGMEPRERDVALVFQSYALYPHMTVRENLSFPLRVAKGSKRLDGKEIDCEVQRVAELLGLASLLDRRPRELSGGQRQRVALGRALIRKPRLFLLDEPLSNLDAQLRASMRAELRRLHEELKVTTIYVTHDQTEAMTMGDRLAALNQGRIQQVGRPHDIYENPANVFVAGFLGYPPMNLLQAQFAAEGFEAGPLHFDAPPDLPEAARQQIVTVGVRPEDIVIGPSDDRGDGDVVQGVVRLVEPAGPTFWVTVELRNRTERTTVVGSSVSGYSPKIGDAVTLSVRCPVPHVFDSSTGQRVGSV